MRDMMVAINAYKELQKDPMYCSIWDQDWKDSDGTSKTWRDTQHIFMVMKMCHIMCHKSVTSHWLSQLSCPKESWGRGLTDNNWSFLSGWGGELFPHPPQSRFVQCNSTNPDLSLSHITYKFWKILSVKDSQYFIQWWTKGTRSRGVSTELSCYTSPFRTS